MADTNPNQSQPPKSSYNPLAGAVNEKNYTQGTNNSQQGDIPEAVFTAPPIDLDAIPSKEPTKGSSASSTSSSSGQQQKPKEPFNPDINSLSDSEQDKAAGQLAQFVVNVYEQAHVLANGQLKISDKKLRKMQIDGDIDMDTPVPYSEGQFVRMGEFIQEYNIACEETLKVEDDFKQSVMPPLTRIFKKRGHGMTDEQYVLFLFGQHASISVFKFINMQKSVKEVINFAREQTAIGRLRPVQPVPAPIQTVAQQQEIVHQEPAIIVPMTMQQEILANHNAKLGSDNRVGVVPEVAPPGMPVFGDPGVLTSMDKIYEEELKQKEKQRKIRERLNNPTVKKRVPRASKNANAIPVAKKRGRPRKNP